MTRKRKSCLLRLLYTDDVRIVANNATAVCGYSKRRHRQRGYLLISIAISSVALIGVLGLTVDLGHMYIGKSEAQTFADSAAIAATLELDGTTAGITRATAAVTSNINKWNFGSKAFTNPTVEFATSANGPWLTTPNPAANYMFTRVTGRVTEALWFVNVVSPRSVGRVSARAVAAQLPKTSFKQGLFPFSPFAHNTAPPDFGLVPGQLYTLRWPSNPNPSNGGNGNVCAGDRQQAMVDLANSYGASERGYIEDTSAALIASTIVDDYQSITRTVGDVVTFTGGAKQSQLSSLTQRINQDSDNTSQNFSNYHGNRRRIVAVPINNGGHPPRIVGIGAFFLRTTGQYGNGGNQSWCAEYVGCWLEGSAHKCGSTSGSGGGGGAYAVRLVQ
jgi:Flp pilus assembly protein TadG